MHDYIHSSTKASQFYRRDVKSPHIYAEPLPVADVKKKSMC